MILGRIVELSVQRRGLVLVGWAAILGIALLAIPKLSVDAVPDVTNVQVSVLTSAPGLAPLEVEQYLTFPVETAMNGLPGVDEIRSISRTAVSAVTVVCIGQIHEVSRRTGTRFIRQIGHEPGCFSSTSGCIGQVIERAGNFVVSGFRA